MKKKLGLFAGLSLASALIYKVISRAKNNSRINNKTGNSNGQTGKNYPLQRPDPEELNKSDDYNWEHKYILANGITFHYVTSGEGPLVVLLHGFPENWFSWREQIPYLAQNHKVVAVDMRGYNLTDKPVGAENYKVPILVEDIKALIFALGSETATIVAHDWGGVVAWAFAMTNQDMLDKLVILNSPHPVGITEALKSTTQALHSWYILLFQLPVIPEFLMSLNNYRTSAKRLASTAEKPEIAFNETDINHYTEAMQQPGASTAMINYYRALLRYGSGIKYSIINTPTLLIWGEKDRFLLKSVNRGIEKYVPGITIKYLPGASHWVHRDEPETVNNLIGEFLK